MIRYLKGETIEVDDLVDHKEKGWQLVLVDGYSARLWETCKRNFEEQIFTWMEMAVIMIRLDKYLADMGVGTRTEVKKN